MNLKTVDPSDIVQHRKLAVFDLDYTLVSINTSYFCLQKLYQKKTIGFLTFLSAIFIKFRFYFTRMSLEKLHHVVFNTLLKGISLPILKEHLDVFLEQCLIDHLYPPAYQELLAAQQRGDYIALFSSSPDFIVEKFAAYFKIPFWEATVYGVDKENRLCNISKLVVGLQKKRLLVKLQKKLGIAREHTVVYSDSYDDLPLFREAETPIAVNPSGKLAKVARKNCWKVI